MRLVPEIARRTVAFYRRHGFWPVVKQASFHVLRKRRIMPETKHLIIEPTSACNLDCLICPRREYSVENSYMSMELLNKILQYPYIGGIELSGWGEPFLHPRIAEMVEIIKRHGVNRVVATTNGTLLERMVEAYTAGLDHMTVSFDAGTKSTYEAIRRGSNWETVIHNLNILSKVDRSLEVNATLMKENRDEIVQLIRVVADTGVKTIKLRNLDLITSNYNRSQTLYYADLSSIINEAKEMAIKRGISLSIAEMNQKKNAFCGLPFTHMYIAATGEVSPCCALGHPISLEDEDGRTDDIYTTFGNVNNQTLLEIWNGPRYIEFREMWRRGDVPNCCEHCYYRRG